MSKSDYNSKLVEAVNSVLLELMSLLGSHRDSIVVVGGLVPSLLLDDTSERHVGSVDVDLLIDHNKVDDAAYATILDLLLKQGYEQGGSPFQFIRNVEIEGERFDVPVDFLGGEYGGTGRRHRHQDVDGLKLRKLHGGDLANADPIEIDIAGTMPDGSKNTAKCRVIQPALLFVLKAFALRDRLKAKDAYDLYFILRDYKGGIERLCSDFRPYLERGAVRDALGILGEKFESPDHVGPGSVADFLEIEDPDDRDMLKRDVFERMQRLLTCLRASSEDSAVT